ncbi:hypothetical protein GCM10011428_33080 [Streptomyces violaceus]|uniref:hypothetical protein n=1 Tax=Streptomyces violaceus TaxID=1936 RepID=UPI0031EB5805
MLLFSLSGRLRPRDTALGALVDRYDYGRFASHLMTSQDVLPVPVLDEQAAPRRLRLPHGDHGLGLASLRILVVATPRGDATLVVDCAFAGETTAGDLAAWLATTCFDRRAHRTRRPPAPPDADRAARPPARPRPERAPTRLPRRTVYNANCSARTWTARRSC